MNILQDEVTKDRLSIFFSSLESEALILCFKISCGAFKSTIAEDPLWTSHIQFLEADTDVYMLLSA